MGKTLEIRILERGYCEQCGTEQSGLVNFGSTAPTISLPSFCCSFHLDYVILEGQILRQT